MCTVHTFLYFYGSDAAVRGVAEALPAPGSGGAAAVALPAVSFVPAGSHSRAMPHYAIPLPVLLHQFQWTSRGRHWRTARCAAGTLLVATTCTSYSTAEGLIHGTTLSCHPSPSFFASTHDDASTFTEAQSSGGPGIGYMLPLPHTSTPVCLLSRHSVNMCVLCVELEACL